MTWLALLGSVAVASGVVVVPGIVLAYVLGLRGLWAWALAAPFGVTIIALASVGAPMVGMKWGVLPVACVFAGILIVLLVVRFLCGGLRGPALHTGQSHRPGKRWGAGVALAVAAVLLSAQLVQVIQAPDNISQTFDNIFHLNAVRFVLDTGNASPLHVGSMTSTDGGVWFYPSTWHAIVSLVVQLSGVDIAVATNALAVVLSALFWPAGVVVLTRAVFGFGNALAISAGVLAAALPSMPLLLLDYGVLYPYALGLSITPAAVAAVLVLLRAGASLGTGPAWIWTVVVLGTLPGIAIAHPGAFMAWLVLASLTVLFTFVRFLRTRPQRGQLITICLGFAAYVAVAFVAWRVLRPPLDARSWGPTLTMGQGLGEALTLSYWGATIPLIALILLVAGIVRCFRRRRTADVWALVVLVAASLLYVAAIAFPWPSLRDLLTAAWYNNAPRLAAIVPMTIIPIAAVGAVSVWWRARAGIARRIQVHTTVFASIAVILLIVGTQAGAVRTAVQRASGAYTLNADSALISSDEMTLLRRLSAEVPADAVIAGSPWTGTGLAYAISGRHVLMPHTLMDVDDDTNLINDQLDEAGRSSVVCAALARKGVEFVLDFGSREVHGAEHSFPGFDDLAKSPAVELVDSEGSAALYRIVACERDAT